MGVEQTEISVKGSLIKFPSISVNGITILVSGNWLKIAVVKDEEWLEKQGVSDPELVLRKISQESLRADIFTFSQRLPNVSKCYDFPFEWDNVAAIDTSDYSNWWNGLSQVTRKNVRRAKKRGLVLKETGFDDHLIEGILKINNETPVRQGRPFWHYGKNFDIVKRDYATFLDRCEYIGAYFEDELVGFAKIIYMGEIASVLQLLSMNKHYDKRPSNALLAKIVEVCSEKGINYLIYGKYIYGNNSDSPLTRFKKSNGFEKIDIPRYVIPLTWKGNFAIKLGIQWGIRQKIPEDVMSFLRNLRSKWYEQRY